MTGIVSVSGKTGPEGIKRLTSQTFRLSKWRPTHKTTTSSVNRKEPENKCLDENWHNQIVFSSVSSFDTYTLLGCDGTVLLRHTNGHFQKGLNVFSQQKHSLNGAELLQLNRALRNFSFILISSFLLFIFQNFLSYALSQTAHWDDTSVREL